MAERIEDLRDWWDRTRRRRLKPQVRAVVERARPAGAEQARSGPTTTPTTTSAAAPVPPEASAAGVVAPLVADRIDDAVPAVVNEPPVAETDAEAETVAEAEAEPAAEAADEEAEPVSEAHAETEPVSEVVVEEEAEPEAGVSAEDEAGLDLEADVDVGPVEARTDEAGDADGVAVEDAPTPEPWSTKPAGVPDGTSADPFAPDWIADVVEETAVDGDIAEGEATAEENGADWMIMDPAAAADRPGVARPAAAVVAHEGWGEDEGVAAIEPAVSPVDERAAEPATPEPWTVVAVAPADREDQVADWSGETVAAIAVAEVEVSADEDDRDAVDLADLPALPDDQEPSLDGGSGHLPELRWAAPGAAPWETPAEDVTDLPADALAGAAAAEFEVAAEPGSVAEPTTDVAAEAFPETVSWVGAGPEIELGAVSPSEVVPDPALEAGLDAAVAADEVAEAELEAGLVAAPEPEAEVEAVVAEVARQPEAELESAADAVLEAELESAAAEPVPAEDGTADPWLLAPPGTSEVAGVAAEAPTPAPDPWAGVTWSAAEQPAPWAPRASAPGDDALDLDEEQRRWLGRDVRLVEGIGPGYGAQLEAVGIASLQDLLLRGATRRGRQEIADSTGISGKLILRWVNNADLFRIRGVGTQYADLLEAAGVDTVVELALRRPDNLTARLATTNEIRRLVRQVPTEVQVADWVRQARELPRIVAY